MTIVELRRDLPRRAGHDLTGVLAHLAAVAFHATPLFCEMVPSPSRRAAILPRYFRILIEHAITHGHIDVHPDHTAMAVWLAAGTPDAPSIPDHDTRIAAACAQYARRFHALEAAMASGHPTGPPHDHLALLAVDPRHRGNGHASRLLAHHHRDLDTTNRPAYLRARSPRAVPLFERHGYRQLTMPNGLPDAPGWPMWRDPAPDDPAQSTVHGPTPDPANRHTRTCP